MVVDLYLHSPSIFPASLLQLSPHPLFQDNIGANPAHYERLPDLSATLEASSSTDSLDHRDILSQLILERLALFPSSTPVVGEVGDATPTVPPTAKEEGMEESFDEGAGPGGSGPASLGTLNVSFPQQMSLSASATSSSEYDCYSSVTGTPVSL